VINVTETKKLTKLDFNGKEIVVNSEDTTVWNQIKVESEDGEFIINEGDTVQFVTNSGEVKQGLAIKLSGKKEKVKIKVAFDDEHDETWGICSIKEDTLKVVGDKEKDIEEDDVDEDEE
jgi:hypothetical protein